MADSWEEREYGVGSYVVLKGVRLLPACSRQPDSWQPVRRPGSFRRLPGGLLGFDHPGLLQGHEATRASARDLTRLNHNVRDMVSIGSPPGS